MKDEKLKNQISKIKTVESHETGQRPLSPGTTSLILHFAFCILIFHSALILAGCARQSQLSSPNRRDGLRQDTIVPDTGKTKAMEIAEDVLTRMDFTIDKFDPNSGFIKTRPLPGAQFFELWRSDNIGTKNWINSNLHSIRRTAEINFVPSSVYSVLRKESQGEQRTIKINCIVKIQRLSLPARDVTSSARAYQMFSMSSPALQTLQIHPEQQRRMAWIDLGRDTELETEIMKRMLKNLKCKVKNAKL